jgi:hypothetical protein
MSVKYPPIDVEKSSSSSDRITQVLIRHCDGDNMTNGPLGEVLPTQGTFVTATKIGITVTQSACHYPHEFIRWSRLVRYIECMQAISTLGLASQSAPNANHLSRSIRASLSLLTYYSFSSIYTLYRASQHTKSPAVSRLAPYNVAKKPLRRWAFPITEALWCKSPTIAQVGCCQKTCRGTGLGAVSSREPSRKIVHRATRVCVLQEASEARSHHR